MYDQDLKRKWDNEAARVNSVQEGMAEGEYKKAIEIAAAMKTKSFPYETISELTKLSIKEIEG